MNALFILLLIFPVAGNAGNDRPVYCGHADLPSGTAKRYILFRTGEKNALVGITQTPTGKNAGEIISEDLDCVRAKSDFRVVNCLKLAEPGAPRRAEAQLTITYHQHLSAGPFFENDPSRTYSSANFQFYFRTDTAPEREINWNPLPEECRAASEREVEYARNILGSHANSR